MVFSNSWGQGPRRRRWRGWGKLCLVCGYAEVIRTCLATSPSAFAAALLISNGTVLAAEPVGFNAQIRPILSQNCFSCHGPDEHGRKADLRLDTEIFAGFGRGNSRAGHQQRSGRGDAAAEVGKITKIGPKSAVGGLVGAGRAVGGVIGRFNPSCGRNCRKFAAQNSPSATPSTTSFWPGWRRWGWSRIPRRRCMNSPAAPLWT